uniref:Uncharacterized protein n=3 Tax=Oryza TaxID=4527 RepID=A0A0D3FRH5_9ORYZ
MRYLALDGCLCIQQIATLQLRLHNAILHCYLIKTEEESKYDLFHTSHNWESWESIGEMAMDHATTVVKRPGQKRRETCFEVKGRYWPDD